MNDERLGEVRNAFVADIIDNDEDPVRAAIFLDWLKDTGYPDLFAMLWAEAIVELHAEPSRYDCTAFTYSCGEFLDTLEKLAEGGCEACRRYAKVKLRVAKSRPQYPSRQCDVCLGTRWMIRRKGLTARHNPLPLTCHGCDGKGAVKWKGRRVANG